MRIVVIGVGNEDRGDDGAGPAVSRVLSNMRLGQVKVVSMSGEPGSLIDAWSDANVVFLIDACVSGSAPGTIQRFSAHEQPLPDHFDTISTHGFGIGSAIELARAVGTLPEFLIVYGIEASSFEHGAPLSTSVKGSVREVAAHITEELSGFQA